MRRHNRRSNGQSPRSDVSRTTLGGAGDHDRRPHARYFVSLCGVCLRHHRQYFLSSIRSGCVRLFFVVE